MALTKQQARIRGRLAAYSQHSKHDVRETTSAARAAFLDRFVQEVDPERLLPEQERQRRAEAARRAYFQRLALASSRSRRSTKKRATPGAGDAGVSPR